ncbi:MAG: bifunctional methylenetetrahydrofolate dehydrogenase/methenyltetrahydrofolate cyclohydrolase FolD [Clostridia bacterium]|nr:bifunctional methylenetetrahydrofolate dehydrogenase/methenyltetrahydrofolate cyclohydrolase FolD [Clostridiales bacterium]MBQ6716006.1 bifunctional methylenetetrahydrofolate dehydrogenase/methenyltetrahydrofolate cyclohydrolase FolD [Clostridia bacterium]
MYTLIDGKEIARQVRADVKVRVKAFTEKYGKAPALCVILAGDNPASKVYVASKEKACGWVGIRSVAKKFSADITEKELIEEIQKLNQDPDINGILVQLPLPKGINEENVLRAVAPEKDVDGFHPMNAGELMRAGAMLEPCTPAGCIELLKRAGVELSGANAVVIGRSNIVGKPIAMMLLRENCTVTICHSKTKNMKDILKNADIIVSAMGRPRAVTGDMLKDGAAVIDVGINRLEDGSIVGDVDFESAAKVCGAITPVPGGVGPMTIAFLMKNTMTAAEMQNA